MRDPHLTAGLPLILAAVLMVGLGAGCGEIGEPAKSPAAPSASAPSPAEGGGKADVYGTDDRVESYAAVDGTLDRQMVQASAMLTRSSWLKLDAIEDGLGFAYRLHRQTRTLQEAKDLCEDVRFAAQPTIGFCSATLVAPDLVLTAGHCIMEESAGLESASCVGANIVFGFGYDEQGEESPDAFAPFDVIPLDDVYFCERVEAGRYDKTAERHTDWALIRLNRPVVGREPVPVLAAPPEVGTQLLMIGHPSGIPQKLSPGEVTMVPYVGADEVRRDNFFAHDCDQLGGNSGGGVFDRARGALAGITSVSSARRYVQDEERACNVVAVCGVNVDCPWVPGSFHAGALLEQLAEDRPDLVEELTIEAASAGH